MEYSIVRNNSDFEVLKNDWNRIEKNCHNCTYFSTFRYCYTWFKNFKSIDEKLFIITVAHNNKTIAIAPLIISFIKGKLFKKRVLQFASKGDYADFLIEKDIDIKPGNIILKILDVLHDKNEEWDEINLTHICHNSVLAHFLLKSKYNKNLEYLIENPFIDFSKYQDYKTYSKKFKATKINHYKNKLDKAIKYKVIATSDNVIKSISKIHIAQKNHSNLNSSKKRHSHFENKPYLEFLNELYNGNSDVLTYLLIDTDKNEEVMCYFTGYIHKNIFHSVSTAVNPKYNHLRLGRIFNFLIYEKNYDNNNWDIFDMGAGRYEWKFELTNSFNLLYTFNFENFKSKRMKFLNKVEKILSTTNQILRN